MNRAWIVCAGLAVGTHALVLFAIRPSTPPPPGNPDGISESIELSIVEAAPAGAEDLPPAMEPEPLSPPEPEVEEMPVEEPEPAVEEPLPEPVVEPVPVPEPVPVIRKIEPKTPSRKEASKPRPTTVARNVPARVGSTPGGVRGSSASGAGGAVGGKNSKVRARSRPKPIFPREAKRAEQQGTVMVVVEVTASGSVASVAILRSSGFPLLDNAALQAVRRYTFEPAIKSGIPVASRAEIPVRFDLTD